MVPFIIIWPCILVIMIVTRLLSGQIVNLWHIVHIVYLLRGPQIKIYALKKS